MKTKQVTHSVLNHLLDYIQNLEKIGLLEEKEIAHLHDAVQVPKVSDSFNKWSIIFCLMLFLSLSLRRLA